MLRRRHILEDEFRGVNEMVKLFRNFFREEPFWSNKPLFPQLSPSKELALMNYVEPLADIYETGKEVVAKIELPGINKEDISIRATDDGIEIKGEKKDEVREEDRKKGRYRLERSYSGFYRYFSLPDNADANKIDASYKDGLLEIKIPKTGKETKRIKEIKVK